LELITMESLEQASLAAALDQMWSRFLPQILERWALVQAGAEAYAEGRLKDDQKEAARDAAHKLAGSLGTFGQASGTVVARELETLISGLGDSNRDLSERLLRLSSDLRKLIENRK
jgi:HPt (histidine-containing phosphotransfer) domain-containing protein